MAVHAKINKLPVHCTPGDCNKPEPVEDEDDLDVAFGCIEEFPACCAITILGKAFDEYGVGDQGDANVLQPRFQKAMEDALKERDCEDTGLVLYAVSDKQQTEHKALQAVGFQEMAVFRAPKTGNRLTLYGKLLNQPRKKPVRD